MNQVINQTDKTPIEVALAVDEDGRTSARTVYEFLELNPSHFSRWAKTNIINNLFAMEGEEYLRLAIDGETPTGGMIKREDYKLTATFAKKICMTSHTERGEEARNYFVKVEGKLKEITVSKQKQPKSRKKPVNLIFRQEMDMAKTLVSMTGVKEGIAYAVALERAEQKTGEDFSSYKRLLPTATHETGFLNPTKIGEQIGKKSRVVNKLLQERGLQEKLDKEWRLTEEGKKYGEEMPYTRNGHSGYQIKWNERVIDVLSAPEVMR
ncbi:antA/AntB antirepressor family protein [Bacillus toyonensis]|uniref:antA/AntB antirepressor family protein n=1 Tax=Bacillus toyonensis TaxID=155322 RepID=UPI0011A62218|nr:antA/AntB antirepressor family protein [Bacillus toyonensis]